MSRYQILHEDKGLAFGNDHACGEFLQIWKRPDNPKDRSEQDQFGPNPEEMLVDLDTRFDKDFTKDKMLEIITLHGFRLDELKKCELKYPEEISTLKLT